MNINIFANSGFTVGRIFRSKPLRRSIAGAAAFFMLAAGALPGAGAPLSASSAELARSSGNVVVNGAGPDYTLFTLSGGSAGFLDWTRFNVGKGEWARFDGAGSTFFNSVSGGEASSILGKIDGTASVWLFNPNGVFFGRGSTVDVGGLFAASTAQIQNLDDLINGDSAVPVLGRNGSGMITVQDGASLTAKEIALAANKISVQGGSSFAANKTTLIAAGKILFDDVNGGKVSIDFSGLAAEDDNSISFDEPGSGEPQEDDTVNFTGDLFAETPGSIDVKESLKAAGRVEFSGGVNEGVTVGVKQMSVASGKLLQGKGVSGFAAGRIRVAGDIKTVDSGDLELESQEKFIDIVKGAVLDVAGKLGLKAKGNVNICGTVTAAGDAIVAATGEGKSVKIGSTGETAAFTAASVEISGAKSAQVQDGSVLKATSGDIEMSGGEYVLVDAGSSVEAKSGKVSVAVGTQEAAGEYAGILGIVSGKDVEITANTGAVLSKAPSVGAFKDKAAGSAAGVFVKGGAIQAEESATVAADGGIVEMAGKSSATGGKSLEIKGGLIVAGEDSSLSVGENGVIALSAPSGIEVKGTVSAAGENATINLVSEKDVVLSGSGNKIGGTVNATASSVDIAGDNTFAYGKVQSGTEDGGLEIKGNAKDVTIKESIDIKGEFSVDGAGEIKLEGGVAASGVEFKGTRTTVAGNIATEGDVNVKSADGTANANLVQESGSIEAGNITAANIEQSNGSMAATGGIAVDGTIKQSQAAGMTSSISAKTITAAKIEQSGGKISATEKITANVEQSGCEIDTPVLEGNLVQTDGSDIATVGEITGNVTQSAGTIQAREGVLTLKGSAEQSEGAVVKAGSLVLGGVAAAGEINLVSSANEISAVSGKADDLILVTKNDIAVGSLEATGDHEVPGQALIVTEGEKSINVSENADVKAAFTLFLSTGGGNVTVGKGAHLESTANNVCISTIDSGNVVMGENSVLTASGELCDVNIGSAGNVTAGGQINATGAALIESNGGDVSVGGAVAAGTFAEVTAANNITVSDTGSVRATGEKVALSAGNNVNIEGAVNAKTYASVTAANGAVTVGGAVSGDSSTAISGKTGVSGAGAVGKAGSALTVANTTSGGINLTGEVKGTTAGFTAEGQSISVANADNDFTGNVTAEGASVTLKDKNGIALGNVTATVGDVTVTTVDGDITVNAGATVKSDAAAVTLTADDNVAVNGTVDAKTVAAAKATNGSVTLAEGSQVTADTKVVLDGKTGVSGKGAVDATGAELDIDAKTGAINLEGVVTAKDADFTAKDGTEGQAISVANADNDFTGNVTANGASVTLKDKNGITLVDVQATAGNVEVTAGGQITATKVYAKGENKSVTLATTADGIEVGDVQAAKQAKLDAATAITTAEGGKVQAGDLDATATTGITLKTAVANATVKDTGTGNVTITEDDAMTLVDVQAKAGDVEVTAGGQITATKVYANGADKSVTLVATDGGIEAGDVQAAKQAMLSATNGAITKSGATAMVTASDLQATAKSGIDLNTTVASVTAETTDAGNIALNETDAVTLTHVKAASGNVEVTAGGKMDVSGVVSATKGDDGTGNVTLATTAGDVDINAAVTAEATAKIEANGKMCVKGDVTGADVDLDAGDFINVAVGKTVKATAGGVSADSAGGNVDVYGTVKAENGSVGITASAEGKSIKVQGADAEVSGATSVTLTGGKSVQILGGANVNSDGSVGATAAEYIAVNGSVNGKTGVTLETTAADKLTAAVGEFPAGAPAGVIVAEGTVESEDGTVSVVSKGSIMVDDQSGVSGKIVVLAANGEGAGQGVQIAGALTATDGTLEITAKGEGGIQASGVLVANNGATTLTAANGSIDAQNADNDFQSLTATAKSVTLNDKNDITLTQVVSANGDIRVKAMSGDLTVADATVDKVTATGDIRLESSEGGIAIGAGVSGNNVTLFAKGDVNTKKTETSNGSLSALNGGDLLVESQNGSITLAADASAEEVAAVLAGNGSITSGKIDAGTIYASGKGDVKVGEAIGNLVTRTDGDVDVEFKDEADHTISYNARGHVKVTAKGGLVIDSATEDGADLKVSEVLWPTGRNDDRKLIDGEDAGTSVAGVTAGEEATLESTASGIEVRTGVDAGTVASLKAKTDVTVLGTVSGKAGVTIDAGGDVTVDGAVVKAGEFTDETTGAVKAGSNADMAITAGNGVTVLDGATVAATGTAEITASGANGVTVTGPDTKLVADKSLAVQATTGEGSVVVSEGAYVAARNSEEGNATAISAENGSVTVSGAATAVEAGKDLSISGAKGVTIAQAKAGANGSLSIGAAGEDASVNVNGGAKVLSEEDIGIDATGAVTVDNAKVAGKTGVTVEADGDITVDGAVVKAGEFTDETTGAVKAGSNADMAITAGNGVTVLDGATVAATGTAEITASGANGVTVTGPDTKLVADKSLAVQATTGEGSVVVSEGAYVAARNSADGNTTTISSEKGYVTVSGAATAVEAGKELSISGAEGVTVDAAKVGANGSLSIGATGEDASVNVNGGAKVLSEEDIGIDAKGAVLVDNAKVAGKTGVTVDAGTDVIVDGAVVKAGEFTDETTGAVKSGSNADMAITAGNGVTVLDGATVAATGTAEITAKGANGVTVTGVDTKLVADKSLTVQATTGEGSVVVSEGAYVAARNSEEGSTTTISSANGSVTVSGAATAVEAGKDLTLTAKTGVTVDAAKAGSDKTLKFKATGDDASVTIEDGAKVLAAEDIDIDAKGAVTVDNATVAAKGDVLVGDATTRAGSFTAQNGAAVTADGSVAAYVAGDATVTKGTGTRTEVSGKTGIIFDATGAVEVNGAVVKAGVIDETTGEVSGEAANLAIAAGGSVTVDGGAKIGSSGATAIDAVSGVTVKGASYVGANTTLDVGTTDGKATASLTVQDSAQLVARDNLTAKTSGAIHVGGDAKVASDKTLKLEATGDGSSVTIEDGAKVLAEGGIGIAATDAVTVDGAKVAGKAGVTIDAGGDVTVDGAVVKVGVIDETTGEVSGEAANLAIAAGGSVTVDGGAKIGSSGATAIDAASGVTVKGESYVGANTTLDVGTTDGKTTASLTVQDSAQLVARGNLTAKTSAAILVEGGAKVASDAGVNFDGETVTVQNGAKVLAEGGIGIAATDAVTVDGATIAGKAGVTIDADGDVTVDGAVVKAGVIDETTGEVSGEAANLAIAAGGSVTVDGGAKIGSSGSTAIDAVSGVTVKGASYVGANTTLDVGMTDGKTTASLTVQDSAQLVARDNLAAKTSGAILVEGGAKVASDASVNFDGETVTVQNGAKVLAAEDIDIDAKGAVLVDNATVAAKGDVLIGDATTRAGSFTVQKGATVTADGSVAVYVAGDATVTKGTGTRTEVSGKTGVTVDADGDITVDGAVVKAGEFTDETTGAVKAGSNANLTIAAGNGVTVLDGATVAATGTAEITASGANGVTVTGPDTKLVADKSLTVQATTGEGSVVVSEGAYVAARNSEEGNATAISAENGSVTVSGAATAVEAGKDLTLTAKTGVTIAQAKAGANGSLSIGATGEDASVNVNGGARVLAEGDIGIDATGAVTVDGAKVAGKTGVTIGAGGDVTVGAGAMVEATAENATLTAGNNADISGAVTAGKNATIAANGTDEADGATISGTVTAGETASVTAAKDVTVANGATFQGANVAITATEGDATIAGNVEATTTTAEVTAGGTVLVSGTVTAQTGATIIANGTDDADGATISGTVTAGETASVAAAKDVTVANGATVQGADVAITATEGDATIAGNVEATTTTAEVTAGGTVLVSGTVTAQTGATVTANGTDEADGAKILGTVTATAGNANVGAANDIIVSGSVEATAENATLTAGNNANIEGTVTAGKNATIAANGTDEADGATISGTVTAGQTAKVEATAGSVEIGGKVKGDSAVLAKAGKGLTVTAGNGNKVEGGNVRLESGEGMTISAGVEGVNITLASTGNTVKTDGNGTLKATAGDIYVNGKDGVTIGAAADATGKTIALVSDSGKITTADAGKLTATTVYAKGTGVTLEGTVEASNVGLTATTGNATVGNINAKGGTTIAVNGKGGAKITAQGGVKIGKVEATWKEVKKTGALEEMSASVTGMTSGGDVNITANSGDVTLDAQVSGRTVTINAGRSITQNEGANVSSGNGTTLTANGGDISLSGTTSAASGDVTITANQNVVFNGNASASGANVTVEAANGNIAQNNSDNTISTGNGGKVDKKEMANAVVATGTATLKAGGSVGSTEKGSSSYVGVDADKTIVNAGENVAVAVRPGDKGKNKAEFHISGIDGEAAKVADVYIPGTPGNADGNTGDAMSSINAKKVIVTAADFKNGEIKLGPKVSDVTVRNFKKGGGSPLIAVFENGSNPAVENLPNDVIVFIDGRLAGGDLKTINKLGALEAFPVQTPELKSEQGIFGNPVFLHGDLGVANPFAVSVIDYLFADIPQVYFNPAADAELPASVDRNIESPGLNPEYTKKFTGKSASSADSASDAGTQDAKPAKGGKAGGKAK